MVFEKCSFFPRESWQTKDRALQEESIFRDTCQKGYPMTNLILQVETN
jgi:hypothetical protein